MKKIWNSLTIVGCVVLSGASFSAVAAPGVICSPGYSHNGIPGVDAANPSSRCVFRCPSDPPSLTACEILQGECAAPSVRAWSPDFQGSSWGYITVYGGSDMFCQR